MFLQPHDNFCQGPVAENWDEACCRLNLAVLLPVFLPTSEVPLDCHSLTAPPRCDDGIPERKWRQRKGWAALLRCVRVPGMFRT